MIELNINNFIKFHVELFNNTKQITNTNIDNVINDIIKLEKEYDKKYSNSILKKKFNKRELIILLLNFIILVQQNEKLIYLNIENLKKIFSSLFDTNNDSFNEIFLNFKDKYLSINDEDIDIEKLCKIFAINLFFFKKHIKYFRIENVIKGFRNKLKERIDNPSLLDNEIEYDEVSYDPEISFLSSSRRKIKSLDNSTRKVKSLYNSTRKVKSLDNKDTFLKSSFKKELEEKQKMKEMKKIKELGEMKKIYNLIIKILYDKLHRLIYYFNIKKTKIEELGIRIEDIITSSFNSTLGSLQIGEPNFNSNNFELLEELINEYNVNNNINYYNYGSEAYLLKFLKINISISEIINFVEKIKSHNKTEDISIKYELNNYLIKIGYDLAICLYLFTNITNMSKIISIKEIIRDKIIPSLLKEINDDYRQKIDENFNKMLNDNSNTYLKLIYSPNTKNNLTKINYLRDIFNNSYSNILEYEQLKYNLYKYDKLEEYDEKTKKTNILWFLNNVILRF